MTKTRAQQTWDHINKGVTSYRTPYDVFESIHGRYNPDKPHTVPFSVWMSAEKTEYLNQRPEASRNQIDGHFL